MESNDGMDEELLARVAMQAKGSMFEANPHSFAQRMETARQAIAEGHGLDEEIGINLEMTKRLYAVYLSNGHERMVKLGREMSARYPGVDIVTGEPFQAGDKILWWPFMKVATRVE